jgi:hypothetical protein
LTKLATIIAAAMVAGLSGPAMAQGFSPSTTISMLCGVQPDGSVDDWGTIATQGAGNGCYHVVIHSQCSGTPAAYAISGGSSVTTLVNIGLLKAIPATGQLYQVHSTGTTNCLGGQLPTITAGSN